MRRPVLTALLCLACVLSGCTGALKGGTVNNPGTHPAPTPNPQSCLAFTVTDAATHRPLKAHVVLGHDQAIDGDTNADGYLYLVVTSAHYTVRITAEGYQPYEGEYDANAWACDAPIALRSAHVNPASIPTATLLAFRGSLFTVKACALPVGARPGQPDNIAPFAPLWATPDQVKCTYDAWRQRGYTHGVMGPGIDPGYHGQVPGYDFRTNPDAFLDRVQDAWDAGFSPIVVVVPDHWGAAEGWGEHTWMVDELRALEPIYRSDRFQRLARLVMLAWEPQGSQYGWRNETYVAYLSWLRDVFPNAIRILHTIADIEAPVGDGDETNTANCHGLPPSRCLSNGQAWANITPLFHVWFHQSSALFTPDHVADNGKTDGENWLLLWDRTNPASFVNRFGRGFAGWPTTSANGGPLIALPAEYKSYRVWWGNESEDEARSWGDRAIDVGAPGAMDGCARCGR